MSSFQYSVASERKPDEPFYDREFQSSVKKAKKLAKKLLNCLRECEVARDGAYRLHELYNEAKRLSEYKSESTRLIGVVGNAGVEGLAFTDSSGKAVTAYPTEYRCRKPDQDANFLIEIEFLNESQVNETLQELLDDYRMPYLCDFNELTPAEFESAEEKSYAARQTLEIAFGSLAASYNDNDESNPGFILKSMKDNSEGAYEAVLDKLQKWAHQDLWPEGVTESLWQREASTVEEVYELMEPFTTQGNWLFLKMARVYLDSTILQNGLVLTDLPGYYDANFSRVRAAKKYQTNCHEIFVVSDIKRAIDDPTIQDIVRDHCKRRTDVGRFTRPGITSICTHTEIIGDDKNIEKHIPKDELDSAKRQRQEALDKPNMSEFESMKAQQEAKDRWKFFLMTARNMRVKKDLKARYSADIDSGDLPVFCVDSRLYHTCRNEDEATISGIPELRMFCHTIQAKALFRTANHYIGTKIPNLISSLESWVQKLHNPISQSLREMGPLEPLSSELKHAESRWRNTVEGSLQSVVNKYSEGIDEIAAAATTTCDSWNTMHPSSYCAWIRNYGTHRTKRMDYKNWNSELIENANNFVAHVWSNLDDAANSGFAWCLAGIESSMDKIALKAQSVNVPQNLVSNLEAQRRHLRYRLQQEFYVFQRGLLIAKGEAFSGNQSSYIAALMKHVYNEGRRDSGKGVTTRHRDRIYYRVSGANLYLELIEMISTNLNQAAQKHFNNVATVFDEVLQAIKADLSANILPDVIILKKHPEFANSVSKMIIRAEDMMEQLQAEAKPATDWARRLGYV